MELRIEADGEALYAGPPAAVPAPGDTIALRGDSRVVEARTWEFSPTAVSVQLLLAAVAYTA